ncbi:hypothetical protein NIES2104_22130 [Leptolyngbya sp. NIES-2104]|nr:hypothetical protein NIES2104_22130 [Leptolyngbya sp. NIES-2104]
MQVSLANVFINCNGFCRKLGNAIEVGLLWVDQSVNSVRDFHDF